MFEIGINREFSVTEARYLRVTNIAAILGAGYMLIWIVIASYLTDAPMVYGSNAFMGIMLLLVLVFNAKGWRVLASMWLVTSA